MTAPDAAGLVETAAEAVRLCWEDHNQGRTGMPSDEDEARAVLAAALPLIADEIGRIDPVESALRGTDAAADLVRSLAEGLGQ